MEKSRPAVGQSPAGRGDEGPWWSGGKAPPPSIHHSLVNLGPTSPHAGPAGDRSGGHSSAPFQRLHRGSRGSLSRAGHREQCGVTASIGTVVTVAGALLLHLPVASAPGTPAFTQDGVTVSRAVTEK